MPTSPKPHLFVYGTLLTVSGHPMGKLLRRHAEAAGTGSIQARLYMIDDPDDPGRNAYPGALPSPDPADRVHGELYLLRDPDAVLPEFDEYEACSANWPEPHEFLLRRIGVRMVNGDVLTALCYLYSWDVSGARRIHSGRFTQYAPDVR